MSGGLLNKSIFKKAFTLYLLVGRSLMMLPGVCTATGENEFLSQAGLLNADWVSSLDLTLENKTNINISIKWHEADLLIVKKSEDTYAAETGFIIYGFDKIISWHDSKIYQTDLLSPEAEKVKSIIKNYFKMLHYRLSSNHHVHSSRQNLVSDSSLIVFATWGNEFPSLPFDKLGALVVSSKSDLTPSQYSSKETAFPFAQRYIASTYLHNEISNMVARHELQLLDYMAFRDLIESHLEETGLKLVAP